MCPWSTTEFNWLQMCCLARYLKNPIMQSLHWINCEWHQDSRIRNGAIHHWNALSEFLRNVWNTQAQNSFIKYFCNHLAQGLLRKYNILRVAYRWGSRRRANVFVEICFSSGAYFRKRLKMFCGKELVLKLSLVVHESVRRHLLRFVLTRICTISAGTNCKNFMVKIQLTCLHVLYELYDCTFSLLL